jgi:hypothetical protein
MAPVKVQVLPQGEVTQWLWVGPMAHVAIPVTVGTELRSTGLAALTSGLNVSQSPALTNACQGTISGHEHQYLDFELDRCC